MTPLRGLMRILTILLALLLGSAGVNQAFASPERIRATHACNDTWTTAPTSERTAERGPPASHDYATTAYDAAEQWSRGASARPGGFSPAGSVHDTTTPTGAQRVLATTTTGAHIQVADGDLAAFPRSCVAARTAGNVVDDAVNAACSFSGDTVVLMADGTTKAIADNDNRFNK